MRAHNRVCTVDFEKRVNGRLRLGWRVAAIAEDEFDLVAQHPSLSVDLRRPENGGRIKRGRPDSTDAAASA